MRCLSLHICVCACDYVRVRVFLYPSLFEHVRVCTACTNLSLCVQARACVSEGSGRVVEINSQKSTGI